MEPETKTTRNLSIFIIIWIGQILSIFGSAVAEFGITLWAYETTGKATPLTLIGVFYTIPMLALSPVVGVMVDRYNRKLMMMLSDLSAALVSVIVLVLLVTGNLQIWHLYVTAVIAGVFQGFHWPAYSAAISTMLPKQHYARANAMLEMAGPASGIFAPMVAGALIGSIGLRGLLVLDLATASFAILTLLFVKIPQPAKSQAGEESRGNIFKEASFGLKYILQRPSLLQLQLVFLLCNFFFGIAVSVRAPYILARTGNDQLIFGSTQSAAAIGGLVGGLLMGIWGGPKRRIHGVLAGWAISCLLGAVIFGMGQTTIVWIVSSFIGTIFAPVINGSNQAIWQSKVPPDLQGRVFAIRRLIAWFVLPLSNALAGPLADRVLEPAMMPGGGLSSVFGGLVGTGPGAGMGLMFVLGGGIATIIAILAYTVPTLREVEVRLPDHDEIQAEPVGA
ncbi:MAG TPA: MFS transporter [Bellilinea sp.]